MATIEKRRQMIQPLREPPPPPRVVECGRCHIEIAAWSAYRIPLGPSGIKLSICERCRDLWLDGDIT